MKYIILFCVFLVGCTTDHGSLEDAANRFLLKKERCLNIADSLNGKGEYRNDGGNWVCLVYRKDHLNNPWISFYEDEISAINRYLLIKNKT